MESNHKWMVIRVTVQPGTKNDQKNLEEALSSGWEPFAVTWDGHMFDYHLKKFK